MRVVILDDSEKANSCGADCGQDWSSAEVIALARRSIEARFGKEITLEYVNLSACGVECLEAGLQRKIGDWGLSLPTLVINGEPRISGQFDMRLMLDAIEAELEINR